MKPFAAAGLTLALLAPGLACAEAYGVRAAKAALSSQRQALIVGVPRQFVHADAKAAPGEAETAGDWSYYFENWLGKNRDRFNVVVVTDAEVRQLFKLARLDRTCSTVFVRDARHALVYDADCAPTLEVYDAGARWAETGALPEARLNLRAVDR